MRNLRIVFMGTPTFAVTTLNAIVEAKYNVVGVVTAPDKPAGRGRKIQQSDVKKYALKKNILTLQPTNLKSDNFLEELKKLDANLYIVVAFRMLPKVVWQLPEYGTFNLHASLLPDYRGAAPINWAIINGETKTGVTTFFINEKIDTGHIILQKETKINSDETVGELHDKLMIIGSKLVIETIKLIESNNVKVIEQPQKEGKIAPKIYTETCKINWNTSIKTIYNLIRGLNPYPAAWSILHQKNDTVKIKIYDVKTELVSHSYQNGKVISSKNEIKIAVKDGYVHIEKLQLAGKRKMDSKSLLNGFSFDENAYLL